MVSTDELQRSITRIENQIGAIVAAQRAVIEALLTTGKMTGALSPSDQEALRGQLLALRTIRTKTPRA